MTVWGVEGAKITCKHVRRTREDKGPEGGPKYNNYLPHHLILIFIQR